MNIEIADIQNQNGGNGLVETRARIRAVPSAEAKDKNDDQIARWGRSCHEGYRKFKHNFLQPAPLFFTQDHHPLWLGDIYRGRSAFLIAGGPSFGLPFFSKSSEYFETM